mmetsp:Transcript_32987/g.49833  ORF Transcript_32987/g.49833 Transcript_32987/m.49833 type:complete len:415 (-) Transcript_32987:82-1326(-)
MNISILIVALHCCLADGFFAPQGTISRPIKSKLFAKKKKGIKPEIDDFDLSGGRPGSIIESEEELARKDEIFKEIKDGTREMPKWTSEYEDPSTLGDMQYDTDDPDVMDASTLGVWDIHDLKAKFDYELDPEKGDPDPNEKDPGLRYVEENPVDEDGVEIGWEPMRGASNPIDTRTIVGTTDSYMIDDDTRDDSMLTPSFHPGDIEQPFNDDIEKFRKSLDIIETYTDPFLGPDVEVPRNVAKWHGLPQRLSYPEKDFTNNRFTKEEDLTDFDSMSPYVARKTAVQYARAKNAEWLPESVSAEYHAKQRAPYEKVGTLMGTLREGEKDPEIVELIQPALKVLGSIVDLLSIEGEGKIFRFHYHGLIKNKYGMSCWAQTLIRDCGVECNNVVFETGFRKRDPQYDGGDPWYGAPY